MSGYGVSSRDEICPRHNLAANQWSLRDVDGSWIRNAVGRARTEQKYDSNIGKEYYVIFSRLYRILPCWIQFDVWRR